MYLALVNSNELCPTLAENEENQSTKNIGIIMNNHIECNAV